MDFKFNGESYNIGEMLIIKTFYGLEYKGILDYVYRKLGEIRLLTEVGDIYFTTSSLIEVIRI